MIEAILKPKNTMTAWYVFEVLDSKDNLMYIGFGKAGDLLQLPTLVTNPAFDAEQFYRVRTIHECENRNEAIRKASHTVMINGMPLLNRTAKINRYGLVKCDQTGQVFKNATTAAKCMGLPQPAMSMHLARRSGHKSIKGLTFSYVGYYGAENNINIEEVIE